MAWALLMLVFLFIIAAAAAEPQGGGGNNRLVDCMNSTVFANNMIIEIPASSRDRILSGINIGGSTSSSTLLLHSTWSMDLAAHHFITAGDDGAESSWLIPVVAENNDGFLQGSSGNGAESWHPVAENDAFLVFFFGSWINERKDNLSVSMAASSFTTSITQYRLPRLFTLQMAASLITLALSFCLLRQSKTGTLMTARMEEVLDFIMKVIFMTEMAVAFVLVLALAFARLCKRRIAMVILVIALAVILEFSRVPKTLTMTVILMTGLFLALVFLRISKSIIMTFMREVGMMLLTALGMVVAFQLVSKRFEMMVILKKRLALAFLYRLPMMATLKTRRALDCLYRLKMTVILMTGLALGVALAFLTVYKRRTVMGILMTSLAVSVVFLKVSKRLRRMVILMNRLVLAVAVAFLDKLLIFMTRLARDFLRISKRCIRMAILITGLAMAMAFVKVSKKLKTMVVILLAPVVAAAVLIFSLSLTSSFHMHIYFKLQAGC